jgi:hypothetical protein
VPSLRVARILSQLLDGPTPVDDLPHQLVTACALAMPVTGVGLILMTSAGPAGTMAVSDGPAGVLEELQFDLGEGPCVECSRTGHPVLQPDLARTGPLRWPGFCAGALEAGVCAVFAFPLRVGGIRLGVLDLYRDRPGELSAPDLVEALSFADAATAMLLHVQDRTARTGTIPLLEDRAEVHQATGMVSVQANASMGEALVRLRAHAFATDRSVLELARDVLNGTVRFTDMYDADEVP